MNKFISLMGLFAFAGFANAFPLLDHITGQDFSKHSQPSWAGEKCMSFAGTWKGACKNAGTEEKTESFTIVQDGCEYIGTKEMQFPIGGVAQFDLTTPTTEKATTDVSHITAGFVWNSDKNALVVDILYLNKALGSMKPFQTFEGQGTLKVDNKKLLVTWTQKDKADVTLCEFDKQ